MMLAKLRMPALLFVAVLLGALLGSHLSTPVVSAKQPPSLVSKTVTFPAGTFCDPSNADPTLVSHTFGSTASCVMDSVPLADAPTSLSLLWEDSNTVWIDGNVGAPPGMSGHNLFVAWRNGQLDLCLQAFNGSTPMFQDQTTVTFSATS